jgi:hypothetical protein
MKSFYCDKIQGERDDSCDFTQHIFEHIEKMPVDVLKVLCKQEHPAPCIEIILKEKGIQI